ncbi:unnamed protein product [Closterium sp. Naga37s-1]|nr:unnamed protein product [Closterium sp. Naga37s-1]
MRTGNHVIETREKQQQQKQPSRTKGDELGGNSSRTAVSELGGTGRTAVGELEIVREEKRSLEKCLQLVVEERDALLELAARNAVDRAVATKSVAGSKKEKERAVDRAAVFESPPSPPCDSASAIGKLGEPLATADRAGLPRRSRAHSAERIQRVGSGAGSFRRPAEGRPQSAERGPRRAGIADGEPAEWEGSGASALIALALEKERESTWEMEYRRELRNGEIMEGAEALRRVRGEDDRAKAREWEAKRDFLREERKRQLAREMGKVGAALQQARSELAGDERRLSAGAAQGGTESAESELAKELEQTKLRLAKVEAERGQLASAVERMVLEMAGAVREQEQFREALQHTSLDTMLLSHALCRA